MPCSQKTPYWPLKIEVKSIMAATGRLVKYIVLSPVTHCHKAFQQACSPLHSRGQCVWSWWAVLWGLDYHRTLTGLRGRCEGWGALRLEMRLGGWWWGGCCTHSHWHSLLGTLRVRWWLNDRTRTASGVRINTHFPTPSPWLLPQFDSHHFPLPHIHTHNPPPTHTAMSPHLPRVKNLSRQSFPRKLTHWLRSSLWDKKILISWVTENPLRPPRAPNARLSDGRCESW